MRDIKSGNYFTNEEYFNKALNIKELAKDSDKHSVGEAFMLLINGQPQGNLDNFIKKIQEHFLNLSDIDLTEEECYSLTQGETIDEKVQMNDNIKNLLYDLSIECLFERKTLGEARTPDGRFNCSEWIGHSIFEGKLAGEIAKAVGLGTDEQEQVIVNGLLHDIGRKNYPDWRHIINGCEYLMDKGWYREATACMTHSFLAGGRNCNNEKALLGLKFDENGKEYFEEGTDKDDITLFLEQYGKYSISDLILNIADLMATSYDIVSPEERINDIAKRRTIDPTNRAYFLKKFTSILIGFGKAMGCNFDELDNNFKDDSEELEEIKEKFSVVSSIFYEKYKELYKNNEVQNNLENQRFSNIETDIKEEER